MTSVASSGRDAGALKLVLFDCDGTLVDSADIIHASMVATFREAGLAEPDKAATKGIIGLTLDIAIATLLKRAPDAESTRLAGRYKEHFIASRHLPSFKEPLYDGIAELIEALARRDDVLIGMVTGKSRRGVERVMETHGFAGHFVTIRTADDCPSKPHPAMVLECCAEMGVDPASTFVIGDAIYDMQMARSAGARAIGVAWGYHNREGLFATGAHAVIDRPGELLPLID
ncbi:phosphoglycolate phosphatase [Aminobacter aminovorans]|uniref:Phosphoglycolate phosphatase n=1 Tax=Aminobacter aminovorans TaxID=83263 RepID=A0A380WNP7_AMIAI|nr:phosphoglycolate phosphatase [Aminobacter aminovorans]SUU89804.1 Phosphoglycolate phosphatase [Aminobacter aminovorans]